MEKLNKNERILSSVNKNSCSSGDLPFAEHIFRLFLSERIKKFNPSLHYLVVVEEKITDSDLSATSPPPRPRIQIQTDVRLHLPERKRAHFKQKQGIFFLAHEDNRARRSATQSRHCLQTGFVNFCKPFATQAEQKALIPAVT